MFAGLSTGKPLQDRLHRIFTSSELQKARQEAMHAREKSEEVFRAGLRILFPRPKFLFSDLQDRMTNYGIEMLLSQYVDGHPNLLEKGKRIIEEEATIAEAEMEVGPEGETYEGIRLGYGGW